MGFLHKMASPNFSQPPHLSSVKTGEFSGLEGLLPARLKVSEPLHLKLVVDSGELIREAIKPTVQHTVSPSLVSSPEPAVFTAPEKPKAEPIRQTVTEKAYAYQTLGEAIFSREIYPLDDSEDMVFEHQIESRFYETAEDAMTALRKLVSTTRINFADQVEIVSRYFYIADYRYRKFAFKARVGLYLKTDWKADKAACVRQLEELSNTAIPYVEASLENQLSIHTTARKLDLLPSREFTERDYTLMSLAAFGTLCVTLYGVFGGWFS
jgi:hypothetical protein